MRLRALWTTLGRVSDDGIPRQYRAACAERSRAFPPGNFKRRSPRCTLQALGAKGRVPCMPRRLGAVSSPDLWWWRMDHEVVARLGETSKAGRILRDSGPGIPPVIKDMWGGRRRGGRTIIPASRASVVVIRGRPVAIHATLRPTSPSSRRAWPSWTGWLTFILLT